MTRRATLLTALLPALVLAACERGTDAPALEDLPPYDGDAAHALLAQQVQFGPRVPGTRGHAQQLAWMTEFLRARADTVQLQHFEHVGPTGTVGMTNVLASFRPDAAERVLLVAHWDTRPMADAETDPASRAQPILGANDGASGVAVLLHLADVLARDQPPIGVDILLVDGEDFGVDAMFLGSTYFAQNLPAGYRPLYGVVVDMVGDRNPVFPIEQNSADMAPEVVQRIWGTAERLGLSHIFPRQAGPAIGDDHIPLNQAGIRTPVIIDFEYGPGNQYWHTLDDDLTRTAPTGLEAVGRVLVALIYGGG